MLMGISQVPGCAIGKFFNWSGPAATMDQPLRAIHPHPHPDAMRYTRLIYIILHVLDTLDIYTQK